MVVQGCFQIVPATVRNVGSVAAVVLGAAASGGASSFSDVHGSLSAASTTAVAGLKSFPTNVLSMKPHFASGLFEACLSSPHGAASSTFSNFWALAARFASASASGCRGAAVGPALESFGCCEPSPIILENIIGLLAVALASLTFGRQALFGLDSVASACFGCSFKMCGPAGVWPYFVEHARARPFVDSTIGGEQLDGIPHDP